MAKRKRRTTSRSSSGKTRSQTRKSAQNSDLFLKIGVGILIVGILAFGAFQFIDVGDTPQSPAAGAELIGDGNFEAVSLEEGRNLQPVDTAPATDRETRYLGPATDPDSLALAEAGELGQPTLVFFHADW